MEEHIRYRLRMHEIIPIEMSQYRIGNQEFLNLHSFPKSIRV